MKRLGFIAGALLVGSAALAQSDPKEEGEDLARSLQPAVQDAARAAPTADSVPGFVTDDPAETGYYADPDAIGADAAVAAGTAEHSLAIQDSMAQRPAVPDAEVAAATTGGFAAQYGAPAALPEFTGTYGACASSLVAGSVVATCGDDVYCISGNCETSARETDADLPEAASGLQMMASLSTEFDETALTVFSGGDYRCRTGFAGALNCCGDEGFISNIVGCPTEAQILEQKLSAGECAYVGKYCSASVLGVCLAKKRSYCCFDSKLSRIIQTQGRAQIGKTFGTPEDPDCDGFSVAEFQSLDFAAMDLTESYEDAVATVNPPAEPDALSDLEAQIAAYYN